MVPTVASVLEGKFVCWSARDTLGEGNDLLLRTLKAGDCKL